MSQEEQTNVASNETNARIDVYLENHWNEIVSDIQSLVKIPSYLDKDSASHDAPFGQGPQAALNCALEIASRMGFETHNLDGYIGYADFPAQAPCKKHKQLGIIGHVDVVDAGPGWNFPAYDVTRKDGYLIGRGVIDDKGPIIVALHALKFWKDSNAKFPHDIRIIFGASEETGMNDVPYYQKHFQDPDFLFTPDAEFPVCYGEKGHFDGRFIAGPFVNGQLISLEAGTAPNAVPGFARATLLQDGKKVQLEAQGKNAHASTPSLGISALGILADKLLQQNAGTEEEQQFLQFLSDAAPCFDGSIYDAACEDADFGSLTSVLGTSATENGQFKVTLDVRYPTTTNADALTASCQALASKYGIRFEATGNDKPFLLDPNSPAVTALLDAYNEATGEDAKAFTMGGGTYARKFKNAASFGPDKPWVKNPDWVGTMHGPNEGVSEELLKEAFRIYVLTIEKLMASL